MRTILKLACVFTTITVFGMHEQSNKELLEHDKERQYLELLPPCPTTFLNNIHTKDIQKLPNECQLLINRFLVGDCSETAEDFMSALGLKLKLTPGWNIREYKVTSDNKYLVIRASVYNKEEYNGYENYCIKKIKKKYKNQIINRIFIVDLEEAEKIKIIDYSDVVLDFDLSSNGRYLLVAYGNTFSVYDFLSKQTKEIQHIYNIREINSFQVSYDGKFVAVVFEVPGHFKLVIYNVNANLELIGFPSLEWPHFAFIENSNYITLQQKGTPIWIFDMEQDKTVNFNGSKLKEIVKKNKDFFVVLMEDDTLLLYDLKTGKKHTLEYSSIKESTKYIDDAHTKFIVDVNKWNNKYVVNYIQKKDNEIKRDWFKIYDLQNDKQTILMNGFVGLEIIEKRYCVWLNKNYLPILHYNNGNNEKTISADIYDISTDKINLSIDIIKEPERVSLVGNKLLIGYSQNDIVGYNVETGEKLENLQEFKFASKDLGDQKITVNKDKNSLNIFRSDKSIIHKLNPYQIKLITWLYTQKSQNIAIYNDPNRPIILTKNQVNIFMTLPMYVCNALRSNYSF